MRYLFLLLIAGLLGCDSTTTNDGDDHLSSHPVDFSNLAIGQESWYLGFDGGSRYNPDNATFQYKQDTLVLSVVDTWESGFVLLERITPGSSSLALWEDSLYYRVSIKNDSITASPIETNFFLSNLFPIFLKSLPLTPVQENQIALDGVIVSPGVQDLYQLGFVINHNQLGQVFSRLNFVEDGSISVVDGPFLTMVYGQEAGIVRTFVTSAWNGMSSGWDLLP